MIDRRVVLDSGPLGLVSNTSASAENLRAWAWLWTLPKGTRIVVPEIVDYEVRRELIRAGKAQGLARLDTIGRVLQYVPLTTRTMKRAAELWAEGRNRGLPSARREAIDADVILAAQAQGLAADGVETIVATTNIKHLAHFVDARLWHEIV